jgi:hypothetical protein
MAINRIRIDYTVYRPNHDPGDVCWDLRTLERARQRARGLGPGSRIYRNFNQTNKRGQELGDWWTDRFFWIWSGKLFIRKIDANRFAGVDGQAGH